MRKNTNKESLSRGLIDTLIIFARKIKEKGINSVHISTELDLNHSQYNNFQKLKYHGLVAKDKRFENKSGYWDITTRGINFLCNRDAIPKYVLVDDNQKVGESDEKVLISQFAPAYDSEYWQTNFKMDVSNYKLF
jgi:hypothetical protein